MTLTGAVIDAVTAERWGIVTDLVATSEEVGTMLDSILMMIETTSPDARAAYKSGITSAVGAQNGLRTVRTARQVNGVEGLNAFRERRPPEWHVAEDGET